MLHVRREFLLEQQVELFVAKRYFETVLELGEKLFANKNRLRRGVRLWRRDGKPRYLDLIPRVWGLLERDLTHPALEPVAQWFDANIPTELREAGGGGFEV